MKVYFKNYFMLIKKKCFLPNYFMLIRNHIFIIINMLNSKIIL